MPDNEVTQQVGLSREGAENLLETSALAMDGIDKLNSSIVAMIAKQDKIIEFTREQTDTLDQLARAQEVSGTAIGPDGERGNIAAVRGAFEDAREEREEREADREEQKQRHEETQEARKEQKSEIERLRERVEAAEEANEAWRDENITELIQLNTRMARATQIAEQNNKVIKDGVERNLKMQEAMLDEMQMSRKEKTEEFLASAGELGDSIQGVGNLIRGITDARDIKGALGGVQSILSSGAGALGTESAAGSVLARGAAALGPVAAVIGTGMAVGAAYDKGMQEYQGARDIAIQYGTDNLLLGASLDAQAKMTGLATGLDKREIEGIQKGLLNNYVGEGTADYEMGYNFAVSARQNYGLSAEQATRMFTRAVIRGGKTVADLNDTLEALKGTVENSNMTMEQAIEAYENATDAWGKAAGDEETGEILAGLQMEHLDAAQQNVMSSLVAAASSAPGYNAIREGYLSDGKTPEEATNLAAQEVVKLNGGGGSSTERFILQSVMQAQQNSGGSVESMSSNLLATGGLWGADARGEFRKWIKSMVADVDPAILSDKYGITSARDVDKLGNEQLAQLASKLVLGATVGMNEGIVKEMQGMGSDKALEIASTGSLINEDDGNFVAAAVRSLFGVLFGASGSMFSSAAPTEMGLGWLDDPNKSIDEILAESKFKQEHGILGFFNSTWGGTEDEQNALASYLIEQGVVSESDIAGMGKAKYRQWISGVADNFLESDASSFSSWLGENAESIKASTSGFAADTVKQDPLEVYVNINLESDDNAYKIKQARYFADRDLANGDN